MSDLCEEYTKKEYIEKPVEKDGIIEIDGKRYIELCQHEATFCKYVEMKRLATSLLFPETPLEVAGHIIENIIHEEPVMFDYDIDFLKEVVDHLQIFINHRKPIDWMNMENDK